MIVEIVVGTLVAGGLFLWGRSKVRRAGMEALEEMPVNQAYQEDFIRISTLSARDVLTRDRLATDDEIVQAVISAFLNHGYTPKPILELGIEGLLPEIKESVEILKELEPTCPDALEQVIRFRNFDFEPGHFRPDTLFSSYPIKTPEPRHHEVYEWLAIEKKAQLSVRRREKLRHAASLGLNRWVVSAVLDKAISEAQRRLRKASKAEIAMAASQIAADELRHVGFDSDVPRVAKVIEQRMLD